MVREGSKLGSRVFSHKKLKTELDSSQKRLNFSSRRDLKELIFVDHQVFAANINRKKKNKIAKEAQSTVA